MAGNFRIDVVVSGGAATGNRNATPISAAAAIAAPLLTNIGNFNPANDFIGVAKTEPLFQNEQKSFVQGYKDQFPESAKEYFEAEQFKNPGKFSTKFNISGKRKLFSRSELTLTGEALNQEDPFNTYNEQTKITTQPILAEPAIQARLKSLGSAAAAKVVYSAVQYAQHTSGNSYYNQQISNAMRLGGYALLLANSGPAAPFVAAGIVVNEGVQAILDVAKFEFDRKMEKYEITNNQILAGNASYGRNRGVGV
jgi:hypothetical protein